jgi:hypothetical protein
MECYYDVHVKIDCNEGYSKGIKTPKAMDDDEVIQYAWDNDLIDRADLCLVDYVEELSEVEFNEIFN